MKSRYAVIAGVAVVAVVALVLSAGLAWGGDGSRMHRDRPSDIQNMSTEEMQEVCGDLHEQMGPMMNGSGMDAMMNGSGMDGARK